jgi:hypothetical protein
MPSTADDPPFDYWAVIQPMALVSRDEAGSIIEFDTDAASSGYPRARPVVP